MADNSEEWLLSISAQSIRRRRLLGVLLASVFVVVGILAWIPGTIHLDQAQGWYRTLPVIGVAVGAILWKQLGTLCAVSLTPNGLRVTRGTTEIMVPLDQIAYVQRNPGQDRRRGFHVRVAFRNATPFGPTIRFQVKHAEQIDTIIQALSESAGLKLE